MAVSLLIVISGAAYLADLQGRILGLESGSDGLNESVAALRMAFLESLENPLLSPDINVGSSGNEIPTVVALFETTLAAAISSSATSFTLTSATMENGSTLASSTYAFIVDEGSASEELVIADCTGTACTGAIRGVDPLTGTSSVTSLKTSHRRGASVKITDGPQLMIVSRILNGVGLLPNLLAYRTDTADCGAGTGNEVICDKEYIDGVAVAGASDAAETTRGIVELATPTETASSTKTGSTGARLVNQTQYSTSSPSVTCGVCIVATDADGKVNQGFLNLSEGWSFTNATSTHFALTSGVLQLNGVNYRWPSVQGASSSVPMTDGSGNITWNNPSWHLLTSTTTSITMKGATTSSFSARKNLMVVVQSAGFSGTGALALLFNGDNATNYTARQFLNGVSQADISGVRSIRFDEGTTTPATWTFMVTNSTSIRKMVTWTGVTNSSGTTIPQLLSGVGVWNNTSDQVTSVSLGGATGVPEFTAGLSIYVYGSD